MEHNFQVRDIISFNTALIKGGITYENTIFVSLIPWFLPNDDVYETSTICMAYTTDLHDRFSIIVIIFPDFHYFS